MKTDIKGTAAPLELPENNTLGSRRKFLAVAGSSTGAMLLAACAGGSSAQTTSQGAAGPALTSPPSSADLVSTPSLTTSLSSDGVEAPAIVSTSSGVSGSGASGGAATSAGVSLPAAVSSRAPEAPVGPASPVQPVSSKALGAPLSIAGLKAFLSARASKTFALPAAASTSTRINWVGQLGSNIAASSLPNGTIVPIANPLINGPLRNELVAGLPGNPMVSGLPCLAVRRAFTCKGKPQTVGSPTVLRFKTDAPVIELAGVVPDGSATVQTLIVDGSLVAPVALSCSRGTGGWSTGSIQISFASRQVRDIWIETAMAIAYVKIDQHDSMIAVDDQTEPQITVVGDSYQLSKSTTFANTAGIALELGARLGVRKVATDGIGGTGYWNSGGSIGNLSDRLQAHSLDQSTIYLVMSGLNDYGNYVAGSGLEWPSTAAYVSAVSGYLTGLRALNPTAVIVVTAPFCPDASISDSSYVGSTAVNTSGLGDFLWKAQLHKNATLQLTPPWVYIDVLMGTGWLNSSGASGDVTNLQWFTGGTPAPGTTASFRPGNTLGGAGGGFGGIQSVPIINAGNYSQAPNLVAIGGSGQGLLLSSQINSSGSLSAVSVLCPGINYTAGSGLPQIGIDPTYQISPAALGTPTLIAGVNPNGQYPLASFAPPGSSGQLNNTYAYLMADLTHPSPLGVSYLSTRLAQNIHAAIQAL